MEVVMKRKSIGRAIIYSVLLVFLFTSIFMFSTTVQAATISVSNNSQLATALTNAKPGDVIVLADGNYSGLTITTQGTAAAPIEVRAANQGKAVFNTGILYLQGANYTTLNGLKFTTSGGTMTIDNKSRNVGVFLEDCNNCRIRRCTFSLGSLTTTTEWVMLGGNSNYNRIDYCDFGPNNVSGHYIFPSGESTIPGVTPPTDRTDWANYNSPYNPNMARYTQIDHNYFHDNAAAETICLGGIGVTGDYQDTYSVIENNLFVNCDGDAEIIAVKASNNTIRYNTVRTSVGMLSLRAGNKNSIYSNFMFQGNKSGAGGIKFYEKDHLIYNNYIDGASEYPILFGGGDAYNSDTFSHAQTFRAKVVNNTVVNMTNRPVIIWHGSALPPTDCVFANNIITGTASTIISEKSGLVNMTYANNIVWPQGGSSGVSGKPTSQFNQVDPKLTTMDGFLKLSSSSPAINAGATGYTFVTQDIEGQPRSTIDIGADEYSTALIVNHPLTSADVGPNVTNLALAKSATASSQWSSSYTPPNAFDGTISTRWVSVKGSTSNEWLRVDLGTSTTYSRVVLTESFDHVTSFKLQSSNDGTNFTDISGGSGTTIGSSKTISFSPVTSRYLRLYIVSATADTNINEMEVYNN